MILLAKNGARGNCEIVFDIPQDQTAEFAHVIAIDHRRIRRRASYIRIRFFKAVEMDAQQKICVVFIGYLRPRISVEICAFVISCEINCESAVRLKLRFASKRDRERHVAFVVLIVEDTSWIITAVTGVKNDNDISGGIYRVGAERKYGYKKRGEKSREYEFFHSVKC